MQLVVVLGAGASVAEAASHRPRHTKDHPPLDTNFFSKVRELGHYHSALRRYAVAAGLSDPFENGREPRMEEFFGDAYFEVLEAGSATVSSAMTLYRQLLRTYTQTIASTTSWYHDRPRGALGRWFRQLLSIENLERLTIVTFNHDLVVENVLLQLPRVQRWCVDQGYGPIELNPVRSAMNVSKMPRHNPATCDHSIPVELLKLHGSLNWQVETRSHEPSFSDLFPRPERQVRIDCITDRVPNVTLSRRRGRRTYKLWPQIVPPVYGKQSVITGRFGALWTYAGERIRQADRLVIVGYSMPVTDVHTEKMLARCIRDNPRLRDLEVINPDPAAAQRFAEIAGADRIGWYRDLSHFKR